MKPTLIFSICTISMSTLFCQQESIPIHDRKFSFEIEQEVKEGKLRETSAAYYFTYIGNYKKSLEYYELPLDWGFDTISYQDSLAFLAYQPFEALSYLEERTRNEQIVIVSEAHQKPQHRVFTTELLDILYRNGFRYLGLETITPNFEDSTRFLMDTLLMQRGYPLNSPVTGFYTREPQMGNLVRKALELGFVIFGYEGTDRKTERDLQQAIQIEKFMRQNPGGKFVIHCGWYHAIESPYPKGQSDNYMAFHLKNRTGIDPLTIYQDVLTEKTKGPESPFYNMVQSDQTSVLLNTNGEVFNGFSNEKHFDILIYHPRTRYTRNRPDWLKNLPGTQFVQLKKEWLENFHFPAMVEAFPAGEVNSVPVDAMEWLSIDDPSELRLQKGHFIIRMTDSKRNVTEHAVSVE